MRIEGVLVSLHVGGSHTITKNSGILFDDEFVLTTGAIFVQLLQDPNEKSWSEEILKSASPTLKYHDYFDKTNFHVYKEIKDERDKHKKLLPVNSKGVGLWKCPLVTHSFKNVFHDWTVKFGCSNDESNDDIHTSKELISVFVLLRCCEEGKGELGRGSETNDDARRGILALKSLAENLVEAKRGQAVQVVSTPFGNEIFFNSLSLGIVSSLTGRENCFLLTDARTVVGCESGPIFDGEKSSDGKDREKRLIGVVTCPLTWWRGEWVGLTLGISLIPVLKNLLSNEANGISFVETVINNSVSSNLRSIDETVVLVRCGNLWGTGVVLDARSKIVITCSHIIESNESVFIFYKRNKYPATVLYKTSENIAYDLAVIQAENADFQMEMEFCKDLPRIGSSVVAAGFPFFSELENLDIRPSIVSGSISKVYPYMIQTTCCIQSGFSGGPLLKDGKLIGLIISNTKNLRGDVIFPHINFVVPSSVFHEPVSLFLKTNKINHLKSLESLNTVVQSLWNLQISKL